MNDQIQTQIKVLKIARLVMTLTVALMPVAFYALKLFEPSVLNIISVACLFIAITDWFVLGFVIKQLNTKSTTHRP